MVSCGTCIDLSSTLCMCHWCRCTCCLWAACVFASPTPWAVWSYALFGFQTARFMCSFAFIGSGSTYLFGHMDATFKLGMTKEECLKWAAEGELSPTLQ